MVLQHQSLWFSSTFVHTQNIEQKKNFIYSPVFFFTLTIIIIMNISKLQQELVSHFKCTCNNSTCLFVYHQKVCMCIQKHNKKLVCFCKLNTHKCVCKKFKNKLFFFPVIVYLFFFFFCYILLTFIFFFIQQKSFKVYFRTHIQFF